MEIGAVEACRLVGRDELAHHILFLRLVQSHLKYFPSRTCEELQKVFAGFTMPPLRVLPNRRAFLRAVRRPPLRADLRQPLANALMIFGEDDLPKRIGRNNTVGARAIVVAVG